VLNDAVVCAVLGTGCCTAPFLQCLGLRSLPRSVDSSFRAE